MNTININIMETDSSNKNTVIKEKLINLENSHNKGDSNEQTDDNNEPVSKRLKTDDNNCSEIVDKSEPKQKLRKWVLLLSYCGHGYYGMQRQSWYQIFIYLINLYFRKAFNQ